MTATHDTITNTIISAATGTFGYIFEPSIATAVVLPLTLWLFGQGFVFFRWYLDRKDRLSSKPESKSRDSA